VGLSRYLHRSSPSDAGQDFEVRAFPPLSTAMQNDAEAHEMAVGSAMTVDGSTS
jgi:hypothetical protein